jgi:peroxiredoxin
MAATSTMVPLGTVLPAFSLPAPDGSTISTDDLTGAPLLVAFVCNHCPYVKHVESGFGELVARHPGLQVVAIMTNDLGGYPQDGPDGMADQATRAGWSFPYLLDESQEVGRAFGAACTPDFFLYDATARLAYRGAMDDSSPGNDRPVTGELLDIAIGLVEAGQPVPEPHRSSMGCSIKWR